MKIQKKNTKSCSNCGKVISVVKNTNDVIFCSKECMNEYSNKNESIIINNEQKSVVNKNKCDVCENELTTNLLIKVNINGKDKNICTNCNKGIIHFSNNIKYLENAIKFLKD